MSLEVRTSANRIRQAELPRRRLERGGLGARAAGLAENAQPRELGHHLVQDLQLLNDELWAGTQAQASDVPTRPREAGDEARPDRVDGPCHDDGYRRSGLLQSSDTRVAPVTITSGLSLTSSAARSGSRSYLNAA
jgi:hypothetical protein